MRCYSSNASVSAPLQPLPTKSFVSTWLFFGTPVVLTFSLGAWQVRRLHRKNMLIEGRRSRLDAPVLSSSEFISAASSPDESALKDLEFRTVRLRGHFLHSHEKFVSPRSAPKNMPHAVLHWGGSSGMQVITPFQLDDGHTILVNRGWIPHRLTEPSKRESAAVSPLTFLDDVPKTSSGHISTNAANNARFDFVGIIRLSHERNPFTPKNLPDQNAWFFIAPREMLQTCELPEEKQLAVVVELIEPVPTSGWPFPRSLDQFVDFRTPPSMHITYAVTWFSLSIALALLARSRILRITRRWRTPQAITKT